MRAVMLCISMLCGCGGATMSADLAGQPAVDLAGADFIGAPAPDLASAADLAGPATDMAIARTPDPCIAAGTCPPGTWVNVTPASVNLGADFPCSACNYGATDIVVDPVRPTDLYAFICYQGVWKSTDYGSTWTHVSTGTNAAHLESGRPATAAIDPNVNRDPATPPTLYTVSLYGDLLGVYKSTDGGVNWSHYSLGNTQGQTSDDAYALDIDPTNSQHLISGFHDVGMSESLDGGQTWKTISVPANFGISVYVWFVQDTAGKLGSSVSSTWITQAQWQNNTNGMWRTADAGKTWARVQTGGAALELEHGHGGAQIYQDGKGTVYASGNATNQGVIFKSTDYGKTWVAAQSSNVGQNGVFGTPNYIYATNNYAYQGDYPQHLQRSPAADGLTWADWMPTQPQGMTNGAKRAAVTSDGTHYIIVTGNYLAGMWRYVE